MTEKKKKSLILCGESTKSGGKCNNVKDTCRFHSKRAIEKKNKEIEENGNEIRDYSDKKKREKN